MAKGFSLNNIISAISKIIGDDEAVDKTEKLNPQQHAHQKEIEASIFVLAAEVIRCDRNYTSSTEEYISQFIQKQFGGRITIQRLRPVADHIEMGTEPFVKIACKELKMLTTYDSRLSIANFLLGVAAADDYINPKEARCVNRIAGYLGIEDADFKPLKSLFSSKHNPYVVLGIEEGVTIDTVKKAYRKMTLKYHPDKRGDEMTEEEANMKFREVQRAFEIIVAQLSKQ